MTTKNKGAFMIAHDTISHPYKDRDKCKFCQEMFKEYELDTKRKGWENEFDLYFRYPKQKIIEMDKFYDNIKSFIRCLLQSHEKQIIGELEERLKQHQDNLKLWENGLLTPTEPDEEERNCVMRELKASIFVLSDAIDKIKESGGI